MKKQIPLFTFLIFVSNLLAGQETRSDSAYLVTLNQQIDQYVIGKNLAALDTLYATDFVFNHGSGLVEDKAGWLKTVANGQYFARQHDSVRVELHPGLAIVKGKLDIRRVDAGQPVNYHLRYIRIYAIKNRHWQMVSHNTTEEKHEKN